MIFGLCFLRLFLSQESYQFDAFIRESEKACKKTKIVISGGQVQTLESESASKELCFWTRPYGQSDSKPLRVAITRPGQTWEARTPVPVDPYRSVRWHIAFGRFWWAYSAFQGTQLQADRMQWLWVDDLRKSRLSSGPDREEDRLPAFMDKTGPLEELGHLNSQDPRIRVHWDFLPVSDDQLLLFLLSNSGEGRPVGGSITTGSLSQSVRTYPADVAVSREWRMEIWSYTGKWGSPPSARQSSKEWLPGTWKQMLVMNDAPFKEAFLVVADKSAWYFVTRSGQVWLLEKGKSKRMKSVWNDSRCPVYAIVDDQEKARIVCMAESEAGRKGVFFQLEPMVFPRPFDAGRGPRREKSMNIVESLALAEKSRGYKRE